MFAFLVSTFRGHIVQVAASFMETANGPMMGLFILGAFFRRTNWLVSEYKRSTIKDVHNTWSVLSIIWYENYFTAFSTTLLGNDAVFRLQSSCLFIHPSLIQLTTCDKYLCPVPL